MCHASAPFANHCEERNRDGLVVNLRPPGFRREQSQSSRETRHGLAERMTLQHFVTEPDVFRVRKSGRIERASFERDQLFVDRSLNAFHRDAQRADDYPSRSSRVRKRF